MLDFYDLASIYDILHTPGTAAEVDGLERIERLHLRPRRPPTWLEPACGTGRYLRVAAGRGRRVVGFDTNERMVAYARRSLAKRNGSVRVHHADMTAFCPPVRESSVGFAFNLINTFRHLLSDADAVAHLEQMRRVLHRSGIYAVGLNCSDPDAESPSEDTWTGVRGVTRVTQVVQYLPSARPRRERVLSHLTVTTPNEEKHIDTAYDLRTYTRKQWESVVDSSGFEISAVVDERGDAHDPGLTGYAVYLLRPC